MTNDFHFSMFSIVTITDGAGLQVYIAMGYVLPNVLITVYFVKTGIVWTDMEYLHYIDLD